jgi:PE family
MMFVNAEPGLIHGAAQDLAGIRSDLDEVLTTTSGPMTGLLPAAQDEVSSAVAQVFGQVGRTFQAQHALAAGFHNSFVAAMKSGASAFAAAEVSNGSDLGGLLGEANQAVSQFIGVNLEGTGNVTFTLGDALSSAGSILTDDGNSFVDNTNFVLGELMNGEFSNANIGQLIGDVTAQAAAGPILQTGGNFLQFVGNGLDQVGGDIFDFGEQLGGF